MSIDEEPFVLVTSKRQKSKNNKLNIRPPGKQYTSCKKKPLRFAEDEDDDEKTFDKSAELRRIIECTRTVEISDYFIQSVQILSNQSKPPITQIVCFGIGRIRHCKTSRYQLAYVLALRSHFNVESIEFHEPLLNHHDEFLLNALNCQLASTNIEGKLKIDSAQTTLAFLPHCPKQLINNFLWKNWSVDVLRHVILIGNSFRAIVEQTPIRCVERDAGFINRIERYTTELTVSNTFEPKNVFNDISIHLVNVGDCDDNIFDYLMASSVYRSLIHELRLASPNGVMSKESLVFKYVSSQFRKYRTTDQQLCKAREEMKFLGNTYLCYLKSLRKQMDIQKHYKGGGERSVKDTADMVGFKLPHDPK